MIRIIKPLDGAPDGLHDKGEAELSSLIRQRAQSNPPTLISDDFKKSVYSSNSVRDALGKVQHWKCSFCEKPLERSYANVEHLRPKTRARSLGGTRRMGYWWLAFRWEHLLLACPNCNNPKSDYWPLEDGNPVEPELVPGRDACHEANLFVDPTQENPEEHIEWVFLADQPPLPARLTARGEATLRILKLREREQLAVAWARHYNRVVVPLIRRWLAADGPGRLELRAEIDGHVSPDAAWVGMTRSAFRQAGML